MSKQASFALGFALAAIIAAGFIRFKVDPAVEELEKSYDQRHMSTYEMGYLDGARNVLFLQQTDTLSPEKYEETWKADSAKFAKQWIYLKQLSGSPSARD